MNAIFRILFLYTSFGPLYLIAGIKFLLGSDGGYIGWIMILLFLLSLLLTGCLIWGMGEPQKKNYSVKDIRPKDGEVFSYILSYIPAIIFRDFNSLDVSIPIFVLYFLIFFLYFRIGNLYIHPFLSILGFRIYEGKLEEGNKLITIIHSGKGLSGNSDLYLREISVAQVYRHEED